MQPNLSKMPVHELKQYVEDLSAQLVHISVYSPKYDKVLEDMRKAGAELKARRPHPRHEI